MFFFVSNKVLLKVTFYTIEVSVDFGVPSENIMCFDHNWIQPPTIVFYSFFLELI